MAPILWKDATIPSYEEGTTSDVTFTVAGNSLTGDYYLWVRMFMKGAIAMNLKDPILYMRTPADLYMRELLSMRANVLSV